MIEFNPEKHCLGVLCLHGHEFANTGLSLRYKHLVKGKSLGHCVQCTRGASLKFNDSHREEVRERGRKQYQANPRKKNQKCREWRKANPEKMRECVRKWRENNVDRVREIRRKWGELHPDAIKGYEHRKAERIKKRRKEDPAYVEYKRAIGRKCAAKACNALSDVYVNGVLACHTSLRTVQIPPELTKLKRIQLKALRASQAFKKGELPCQTKSQSNE